MKRDTKPAIPSELIDACVRLNTASNSRFIGRLHDHFSAIVWFVLPASFELYDQANKRIVRSGQKSTVSIYRIIAINGIADPKIVERLAEKEAEQDEFYEYLENKQRTANA